MQYSIENPTVLADYEGIAVELIRALRGRRSCAELSRRAGYRSNIAHRWEARQCWPTAARYLEMHRALKPQGPSWLERFFPTPPSWVSEHDATSKEAVAAFLRHLKGKTPIARIAALAGHHRSSVSRFLDGSAEPKLPELLKLVDVSSRRLLDLLGALEDPARLPSVRERFEQLQLAREAAYRLPWSHAVLRVLELEGGPRGRGAQVLWVARTLRIDAEVVNEAFAVLEATGQVKKTRDGYKPREVIAVDTGHDPVRSRELKAAWTQTALERMRAGAPGSFGYSVFAVARVDLAKLQSIHLQYVRAMQDVIASSRPSECVGLYCAQLLDLGGGPA